MPERWGEGAAEVAVDPERCLVRAAGVAVVDADNPHRLTDRSRRRLGADLEVRLRRLPAAAT